MSKLYKDIKKYRKYIVFSAKADLKSEVTNSYLDWVWWVLEPVCNMFIYYFIFGYIFKSKEDYFLVFIYIGLTFWSFFKSSLKTAVVLIRKSKRIVTKVYIPKQMILMSKLLVNGFKMLISFGIIVILMFIYRIKVDFHVLWLIPIIIVFMLFTYGCCCILLHYGVYVDDLQYITSIVLSMLFFFTGIFYSINNKFPVEYKNICLYGNPIAFLIDSCRRVLLYSKNVVFIPLLIWLVVSIIVSIIGTRLIYKNENSYVKVI